MSAERCETCRYWQPRMVQMPALMPDQKRWVCVRFPRYEHRNHTEWCGEWRAREADAKWLEREP
jgi:hypothetical protein